jgi:mono/diheme cytochrome c family protein
MVDKSGLMISLAALAVVTILSAGASAGDDGFPPRVNPGRLASVQKIKNPVAPDAGSIADGKEIFFGKGLCTSCHGDTGKGDGPAAPSFNPPPRDFTNAGWQKVRTDGEIFIAITEGTQFGMLPYGDGLTEREKWDLVNFLRTFGKSK